MLKIPFFKSRNINNLKHPAKVIFGVIALLYPLLIFCSLVVFRFPIRYLSIIIIIFAVVYIFINRRNYKGKHTSLIFISPAILCSLGILCLFTESAMVLKMYPALIDLVYIIIFTTSLFIPPPLVFYFVNILDKSVKDKLSPKKFEDYCRKATIVWCIFFIVDGIIAMFTVFWVSEFIWGLYNGGITYVVMGLLFVGEFVILKIIEKKALLEKQGLEKANVHT